MMLPMPPDRIREKKVIPVQWRTTFLMSSSATAAASIRFQYLVAGQQHGANDRIPHNVLLLHMDFGYGFIVPYRRRVCNRRLVNTMQEMPLIFNRTVTGL